LLGLNLAGILDIHTALTSQPMSAVLAEWPDDDDAPGPAATPLRNRPPTGELSPKVAAAIWRGTELGHRDGPVMSTGFADLDRELPGGGWPCNAVTDVLSPQSSVLEWRLLGPTLQAAVAAGKQVVLISPPKTPHLPGLHHAGIDAKHLVWVRAEAPAERLWCTLAKSGLTTVDQPAAQKRQCPDTGCRFVESIPTLCAQQQCRRIPMRKLTRKQARIGASRSTTADRGTDTPPA
jgi:hypothetical protein